MGLSVWCAVEDFVSETGNQWLHQSVTTCSRPWEMNSDDGAASPTSWLKLCRLIKRVTNALDGVYIERCAVNQVHDPEDLVDDGPRRLERMNHQHQISRAEHASLRGRLSIDQDMRSPSNHIRSSRASRLLAASRAECRVSTVSGGSFLWRTTSQAPQPLRSCPISILFKSPFGYPHYSRPENRKAFVILAGRIFRGRTTPYE